MLQNSFSHCPQSWPSLSSLSPTPSSKQKQGSEMSSSLFTVVQWQELEHQALIFKYFKAGLPVPPDLLAPIRRSFQFMSPSLFSQPASLGYCSYFGKKIDPEPGRCRRTDGKKWRCSKEAHPDSKYCERHMNRGRYRSRKLVELRTTYSQSLSTASSDVPTGSSSSSTGSLRKTPLHSTGNSKSLCFGSKTTKLQVDHFPYGISNNEYRGVRGMNVESGKHNFLAEISGSVRGVRTDSGDESSWCFPASQIPFLSSESRSRSLLLSSNQQQTFQDIEQPNVDALVSKQEQHCFFGKEIDMPLSAKQEHNMLQPLCDQWPKTRDLVSHPDDHRSSKDLVTTTQLSMSSSTSDFFTRNAQSPSDALRRT